MSDELPAITQDSAFAMLRQRCQDLEDLHRSVLDVNNELRFQAARDAPCSVAMLPCLVAGHWRESSAELLRIALGATQSECGFIGIVMESGALRILAHEGIAWDLRLNGAFEENLRRTDAETGCLEFARFDNVFGRVVASAQALLTNNAPNDPRACGSLPFDHPTLVQFLGVPARHDGRVVGMVALADRAGGYGAEQLREAEALAAVVGSLCERYRRSLQIAGWEAQLQQRQSQLMGLLEERESIGQRMHDDIRQTLSSLRRSLDEIAQVSCVRLSPGGLALAPLIGVVDRLIADVRGYLLGGIADGEPSTFAEQSGIDGTSDGEASAPPRECRPNET